MKKEVFENMRKSSGLVRCDCCGHQMYQMDSVFVTFNSLKPNSLQMQLTRYRLCSYCSNPIKWRLEDCADKPVFQPGVTLRELKELGVA